MTETIPTASDHLRVASDVAKRSHDVLVKWPDGRTRALKVQSQRDGFEDLTTYLLGQESLVRAALEPTGDYPRSLAYWLSSKGIEPPGIVTCICTGRGGDVQLLGQERPLRMRRSSCTCWNTG